ncbi:MAG TPA: class I SAM-dependent methyltransferase [Alphaproteobacteria bacterium]
MSPAADRDRRPDRRERGPRAAGDWDPERYRRDAGFVPEFGHGALSWLRPLPGERILDLGCGDGTLTAEFAARGAEVVSVDTSPAQVAAARARGLDARVMSGEALEFQREFNAVFSNAALHWMREPDAVIAGVARALEPGGRFVAELGAAGNIDTVLAAILAALESRGLDGRSAVPWYFPTPEAYAAKLAAGGFGIRRMTRFARPTDLPGEMRDWLEIFARSFAALVPEEGKAALFADIAERLRPHLFDAARGVWWVDYVRLRFEAAMP